jgi:heterodisulfide reductase subunit C
VIDALRQIAVERSVDSSAQRRTTLFLKAFLQNVRKNGRVAEFELVGQFKTSVFLKDLNVPFLMKDAMLGPKMLGKGKLHLKGEQVRDRALVGRIFDRCLAQTHETVKAAEGQH